MSAITVLNKNNVPTGPFTRAQVAEKLKTGEFSLDDLAFVEGLAQWTPLRDVLAKVDATPLLVPPVPAPAAASSYSYAATMRPPGHFVYAGFWLRFVAIIIDGLVFSPLTAISLVLQEISKRYAYSPTNHLFFTAISLGFTLLIIILRWLYFALMESSSWQATLGKRVLGLQVTGLNGERIGFAQATGRYFGKILSALLCLIGFIMAGVTERKQALHDMLASTLVIRR